MKLYCRPVDILCYNNILWVNQLLETSGVPCQVTRIDGALSRGPICAFMPVASVLSARNSRLLVSADKLILQDIVTSPLVYQYLHNTSSGPLPGRRQPPVAGDGPAVALYLVFAGVCLDQCRQSHRFWCFMLPLHIVPCTYVILGNEMPINWKFFNMQFVWFKSKHVNELAVY